MNTHPSEESISFEFNTVVAEAIAHNGTVPADLVRRVYEEELACLAANARVTQFLGVLATRRARQRLHVARMTPVAQLTRRT